ncbi:hypothetical protein BDW02DRAFT_632042 [Decorospora gaudefroyi]|uniref:Uncharacterized protein n=1 Tax=Decorospora gaudefroyi TaxID=184978 RepID=A0A6A5K7L5_9PLEO|nr:hypothetical protein BDW02DRAFT_632042 [Decorospora gaudefroyi]
MTSFISNIIWNSVEGFVDAGKKTAGEYGGNALIKAGDMIESSGRSVGNGIEKKATGYGAAITGQTYQPTAKALPSTARKPAIKRSNSTPASIKPATSGVRVGSGTPIGAKKYPGVNQVSGATGGVKKSIGGGGVGGGVNKTVGGVTGNASKVTGGVIGGGQKAVGGVSSNASRVTGGVVGRTNSTAGRVTNTATKSIPPFKGPGSTAAAPNKTLPKPYPNANGLPKPSNAPAFPTEKKAAVRPGVPKPFAAPAEQKKPNAKTPYPGTSTLPGQAPKVPVQQQKYKPLPRLSPQVGQGQTMTHISV